ncbi:MAG: hypothetical protein HUU02_09230 [Bacteroidetes bacterium]|nr:hypothetical protein [Bacteroidota bacterium]
MSGTFNAENERFMLTSAHALAENLLRMKFIQSPSVKLHLGLNERDLGYDCIAELFERDDQKQLVHLVTYFSNFNISSLSDQELLLQFRRLVTSAVNQSLMHVYRDFDPELGKIIRNIKLAVNAHKAFIESDRFDEFCITPIDADGAEHRPTPDQLTIFELMTQHVTGNEFVPQMLSIYARIIREQEEYSRIVPLLTIALAFRALYASKHSHATQSTNGHATSFEMEEIIRHRITVIRSSILKHHHHTSAPIEHVHHYFQTIQDIFLSKIDASEVKAESMFKGLRSYISDLTMDEYRRSHRTKLEYYYRLCREAIATDIIDNRFL